MPVLALAFLLEIVLFSPSVSQSYCCPKPALFDTRDHLESLEHIISKSISLVLAQSKINPGNENRAFSFVGIKTFF